MKEKVLITGGAGFIGSYITDILLKQGHRVRILDNLSEQVHGPQKLPPEYLNPDAELIIGDVRDEIAVKKALQGITVVYHLAAAVGIGQSMYEIEQYVSTNSTGTAVLLQQLIHHPVKMLMVASSMSIYGEGLYLSSKGHTYPQVQRDTVLVKQGLWDPLDQTGKPLTPLSTPETKSPNLSSVYALSKYDQERMCLMIGDAYSIPTVALRFFNVYGPRQALSNPYTGVLAIFASRLLNGKAPLIFEDGNQLRDFVSVHDVARACAGLLDKPQARGRVFNIGSGEHYTVSEIAEKLRQVMSVSDIEAEITGQYRVGDVRHCFADIAASKEILGYSPQVTLTEGLRELALWLTRQKAVDRVEEAKKELVRRGLAI